MNDDDTPENVTEARLWSADGWTARVLKNEDDDGWAVAMFQRGQAEPALVGPWTMGRDKKNPKPLDQAAFLTLVKTAREVLRRHEQQERARLHKEIEVDADDGTRWLVTLDIVADEDDPHALLAACDRFGAGSARARVRADFRLSAQSARDWIASGFGTPR